MQITVADYDEIARSSAGHIIIESILRDAFFMLFRKRSSFNLVRRDDVASRKPQSQNPL